MPTIATIALRYLDDPAALKDLPEPVRLPSLFLFPAMASASVYVGGQLLLGLRFGAESALPWVMALLVFMVFALMLSFAGTLLVFGAVRLAGGCGYWKLIFPILFFSGLPFVFSTPLALFALSSGDGGVTVFLFGFLGHAALFLWSLKLALRGLYVHFHLRPWKALWAVMLPLSLPAVVLSLGCLWFVYFILALV